MLKALIKKELLQLNQFYFYNRKKKKIRSKKSIIGMIVLFVFLFSYIGVAIGFMDYAMAKPFVSMNMDWLYFSMTGLIAIVLGVFGDIFNTYSLLYKSKDNDLLLSMPVKPSALLTSRIAGVFIMGMLYESIAFIPAVAVYWIVKKAVVISTLICQIFIWLFNGIFVTIITCVLGWFVALISTKLTNKNIVKSLATIAFLGLYYLVYFKAVNALQNVAVYANQIADVVSGWLFLSYHLGNGAAGKISSLMIYLGIVSALFAVTYLVMLKSYISTITTVRGSKKIEYHKKQNRKNSVMRALVGKELKHFVSSSAYMMNLGLGLIITTGVSVFALIKTNDIRNILLMIDSLPKDLIWLKSAVPVVLAVAPMMLISMNMISAPSLSLEGKNLWILQSSPVPAGDVFKAKLIYHFVLCAFPTILLPSVLSFIFKVGFANGLLIVLTDLFFMILVETAGLWIDSKKYNLNWTNEVYPIKQGFSITVVMFSGWGTTLACGGLFYLLRNTFAPALFLSLLIIVFIALSILAYRNLMKTASKEFPYMS